MAAIMLVGFFAFFLNFAGYDKAYKRALSDGKFVRCVPWMMSTVVIYFGTVALAAYVAGK